MKEGLFLVVGTFAIFGFDRVFIVPMNRFFYGKLGKIPFPDFARGFLAGILFVLLNLAIHFPAL